MSMDDFATTSTITEKAIKNIALDGTTLRAKQTISTFNVIYKQLPGVYNPCIVGKKLIGQKVKTINFNLTEVTPAELLAYRMAGTPSFVLKDNGKFYYTEIVSNLSFVSSNIIGEHQCAVVGKECRRLSAASDEDGGCAKVRDFSRGIERYPWITTGYETFNTQLDVFVVCNCLNYEICPPRK